MDLWYCETCGYFDLSEPKTVKRSAHFLKEYWDCPVCKEAVLNISRRSPLQEFNEPQLKEWIEELNESFPSGRLDDRRPQYAPLNWLVETFHWASYFIHITTATPPDDFFLGMLALKQAMYRHCYIRILTWRGKKNFQTLDMLGQSGFLPGVFTIGMEMETVPQLHQKLIIVDGLVAFKGSANATLTSWTREGELIEFTTNPSEVKALNDEYFVRFLWRK